VTESEGGEATTMLVDVSVIVGEKIVEVAISVPVRGEMVSAFVKVESVRSVKKDKGFIASPSNLWSYIVSLSFTWDA
jgi:hypothetical protein